MKFAIYNKEGEPISMRILYIEAAEFWKVEFSAKKYASTENCYYSWFDNIGTAIADLNQGKHKWSEVIGYFAGVAAIGEHSFQEFIDALKPFKPLIELCIYWESKGYTPVSC